jgi:hypothetical protein
LEENNHRRIQEFEQEINSEIILPIKKLPSSVVDTSEVANFFFFFFFFNSRGQHNFEPAILNQKGKRREEG